MYGRARVVLAGQFHEELQNSARSHPVLDKIRGRGSRTENGLQCEGGLKLHLNNWILM